MASKQWESLDAYLAHRATLLKTVMSKYGMSKHAAQRAMFFKETMEEIEDGIVHYLPEQQCLENGIKSIKQHPGNSEK